MRKKVAGSASARAKVTPKKGPASKAAPMSKAKAAAVDPAAELAKVKRVVKEHLPKGYKEVAQGSLTCWVVPLTAYPDSYNGHPLWYVAMGPQKNYLSLHLVNVYGSKPLQQKLAAGFKAAGKKLNMGKACLRFKRADDLALDVIGAIVAATPMADYIAMAKSVRRK